MSGYPIDRRIKHATLNAFKADKIPIDSTYFDNTGSLITPKTIITQEGNTFNGANQLVKLDANSKLPIADGSNLTNVVASGLAPSVPYSVISAKTDANGYGSFITKVSNTEISFDTNSGSIPIKICYPDGSIETNNSLPNITGISTDGTYYTVKEKGSNPYNTTLQPVESNTAPSTPSTNQLWLDISVIPYIPKKWNGSSWDITQFVKLGEFVRTAGVIGTPISYALNGIYAYSATVSINTIYTLNCNIGSNYSINGYIIDNTQSGATNETVPLNNFNYDSTGTGTGTNVSQTSVNIIKVITSINSLGGIRGLGTYYPRSFSNGTLKLICKRSF